MAESGIVVISGLPAAGKTTLGKALAKLLGFAFLDKDDILEASFDQHQIVDPELRQSLSRAADVDFVKRATRLPSAVLVSFWRPLGHSVAYGTPTEWLTELHSPVVEIHCLCKPDIALGRFQRRKRHPAHNDSARHRSLQKQFEDLAELGPLGAWPCVKVDMSDENKLSANIALAHRRVVALLERAA